MDAVCKSKQFVIEENLCWYQYYYCESHCKCQNVSSTVNTCATSCCWWWPAIKYPSHMTAGDDYCDLTEVYDTPMESALVYYAIEEMLNPGTPIPLIFTHLPDITGASYNHYIQLKDLKATSLKHSSLQLMEQCNTTSMTQMMDFLCVQTGKMMSNDLISTYKRALELILLVVRANQERRYSATDRTTPKLSIDTPINTGKSATTMKLSLGISQKEKLSRFEQSLKSEHPDPNDWHKLWRSLKKIGWSAERATNMFDNWYYKPPGGKVDGGIAGVNYFCNKIDMVNFIKSHDN
jgi:hypothetical protein